MKGPCRCSATRPTVPQAKAAEKGRRVVAQSAARWKFLKPIGLSAADDDLVGQQGRAETLDDGMHLATPLLLAQALVAAFAEQVFVIVVLAASQVAEFHRHDLPVDDQRGPQAGAQTQE